MINLKELSSELKKLIYESENIAVASHLNPDGDNLGSVTAMVGMLKKLGKNAVYVLDDTIPNSFKFLPNLSYAKSPDNINNVFDLFIALDSSDENRMGENIKKIFKASKKTVNIDHHFSNTKFADLNIVDDKSPATCEVLARIFESLDLKLNKEIATSLFTGLSTDTGSFKYSSVNSNTFLIASNLFKYDIDINEVTVNVYQSRSRQKTDLLIRAMNSIEYFDNDKIAVVFVTKDDMEKSKAEKADADGIVEFVRDIDTVELAVLLKEKDDCIRLSLRSKSYIDCTKVASKFNGGGHVRASGGTINHTDLNKAKEDVVKVAEEQL
ncbi:bifunctional oligoribonuclease/PAP phosphatase NrnA [Peptoniphilus sp. AGMB00490]|uniref:Bifunctional oligoribonuclease/PAP phosphatase NrnA n=1 Tax=Peptoniphilus faecalis TaxID=2731255 RepID=A0A848RKF4_9FIRM|nr:bifunctional oligoribonuclease/PAP phosphatase NrnA [Peptoniphilus faecalis]NMW84604.1 bifunctional oligoribonuclease/PAP phosphatase NrnA [Peptoniphilus faecalis]